MATAPRRRIGRAAWAGPVVLGLLALLSPLDRASAAGQELRPGINKRVPYGTAGGVELTLEAHMPTQSGTNRPVVIIVHGGGWRFGSPSDLRDVAISFTDLGWPAMLISYRLDVPAGFPAEVEDVEQAIRWVRENSDRLGTDPGRIAVVGSSAGANLAALAGARGAGPPTEGSRVRAVVSWSGPMDLPRLVVDADPDVRVDEIVTRYLGCTAAECPETYRAASPITHVDPTDPPMFLANSRDEDIPESQAENMGERLRAAGVPAEVHVIEGHEHGRGLIIPLWAEAVAFLQRQFGLPVSSPPSEPVGVVPIRPELDPSTDEGSQPGKDQRRRDEAEAGPGGSNTTVTTQPVAPPTTASEEGALTAKERNLAASDDGSRVRDLALIGAGGVVAAGGLVAVRRARRRPPPPAGPDDAGLVSAGARRR